LYCRKCGAENPDHAVLCVKCGESLQPAAPAAGPQTVPNHLVEAILVTIFCCLIPGIVAIVYAAQVNGKLAAGDYAGAVDSSNKAKTWTRVSFGLGLAAIAVYVIVIVTGAALAPRPHY
jgi:uncharacterized membrane protein YvbJ